MLAAENRPSVIVNATIVDPVAGAIRPRRSVVVRDGHIAEVLTGRPEPGLDDHGRVDLRGAFLVPGLIDTHVHMCAWPGEGAGQSAGTVARLALNAKRNLRTALVAGVTTVRDLGGGPEAPFEVKRAWHEGLLAGARPLVAGPMITAVGGHGTERALPFGIEVSGVEEIRRAVRRTVAAGADAIKLVTAGLVTHGKLSEAELLAASDEAHRASVPVAVHANFELQGIRNAIAARCDSVEHGCVADHAALEAMAEHAIGLCPTLTVMARIRQRPDLYGGPGTPLRDAADRTWEPHLANVGTAAELGVPLIAGTDAGMLGVDFDTCIEELEWLVECGLTPHAALRCATVSAARALGREDIGEIAPGRSADAVVVGSDPLADVSALRDVRAVMLAGRWAQRACFQNPD